MEYIKEGKYLKIEDQGELRKTVGDIVAKVQNEGDKGLKELVAKFDKSTRDSYFVTREEIDEAYGQVSEEIIEALKLAIGNIEKFSLLQKDAIKGIEPTEVMPGVSLGQRIIPIEEALCYVPGGSYPLFSTAIMLIVPARVAGVKRIAACSPPAGDNKIDPITLVAMDMAGATEIAVMGGAQAIAAYAYGTETVDPVNIIVGPGNQYVTEAKRQCYGKVGIDFIAGPSEVLVVADSNGDAEIIAADLLAQAEHDLNARSILLSTDRDLCLAVKDEVEAQLKELDTKAIAEKSWEDNGQIIYLESLDEAVALSDKMAPEHLIVNIDESFDLTKFTNYGSMFIGKFSAEVFGDYTAGTNHTLPTLEAAKYTGGVDVGTFTKTVTFQKLSEEGYLNLKEATEILAGNEGLTAHKNTVSKRAKYLG